MNSNLMDNKEKCVFNGDFGTCSALTVEYCNGLNTKCSFYKTAAQYTEDSDRAIDICRKKGLCKGCRYIKNGKGKFGPVCKKSNEV